MKRNPISWWRLGLLALLLSGIWPASAQSGLQARLSPPDTQAFPEIITYLTLRTADGQPAPAITTDNLQLLEDDQPVPEFSLESISPGLQLAVAVNAAPEFAIRNSQGLMRFDFLRQALLNWGKQRAAADDLSLVYPGGELAHAPQPSLWLERLQSSLPDPRDSTPDYQILGQALDLAADPPPRQGMGRAVLFITPLPEAGIVNGLQSLAARASQQDVSLFFWVVTSAQNFDLPQSRQLRALAESTGGQVFFFSGNETIPDLETWFAPLRKVYRIRYASRIRGGEEHLLQAVISLPEGGEITAAAPAFRYVVLPPNPIFIEPPLEIRRAAPTPPQAGALQTLSPAAQPLKILVDFPDGHPRDITLARLYVDGELVDENTATPYTAFTWDLRPYTAAGEHRLQVEVVDTLGLSGRSAEHFVTVAVDLPAPALSSRVRTLFSLLGLFLLGLLTLAGLWYRLVSDVTLLNREKARRRPVRKTTPPRKSGAAQWRLPWRAPRGGSVYLGQLIPLQQNGHRAAPIRLVSEEVIIGSERGQAAVVMQHPSIAPAHARLTFSPQEGFRLYDLDSPAGTWCNYLPVPPQGTPLRHGDIIHIGARAYRLALPRPRPRQIRIQPVSHSPQP